MSSSICSVLDPATLRYGTKGSDLEGRLDVYATAPDPPIISEPRPVVTQFSASQHEVRTDLSHEPEVLELDDLANANVARATKPPSFLMTLPSPAEPPAKELKAQKTFELAGFAAVSLFMFLQGWNDGTSGPMLPAMQRYYHLGFTSVSLVFVANSIGYIAGSLANIHLTSKLGFGKTLVIGAVCQVIGYAVEGPAPPFPVLAIAYTFPGFGISLQAAQAIMFISSLKDSATKMGICLAVYGLGALMSPLIATQFAPMDKWASFFFISMGLGVANTVALVCVFRFERLEPVLLKLGQTPREQSDSNENHYRQILGLRAVHVLAFFTLAYVGVEVTIGGWIVTFVKEKRGGGESSGYLTSGFFAGLTVGRLVLLWLNQKIGERRITWMYIVLAICLEITIWFVPSLVGNGVAVAFVGFFMGPIYPIIMNRAGKLIPPWILSGAVGWIAGLGQTGSAILPFIAGTMLQKLGVTSLQPLVIVVLCIMTMLWALVPPDIRRQD